MAVTVRAGADAVVPTWRGRLHQVAAVLAVPAGALLVASAPHAARPAAAVYAVTLVAVFAVSAAYHRVAWSPAWKRRMKRADHSTIFGFIAGSYTIFAALALPAPWHAVLTALAWFGALAGSVVKQRRLEQPGGAADLCYQGLGWLGAAALPYLVTVLAPYQLALIVVGGLLSTGGAVVMGRRTPDPSPAVFGYHEVGHLIILGGTVAHYALFLTLT